MGRIRLSFIILLLCACSKGMAQTDSVIDFSNKEIKSLEKKIDGISKGVDKQTQSLISDVSKNEEKIKNKLSKIDSLTSTQLFTGQADKYKKLASSLKDKADKLKGKLPTEYIPGLDSLNSAFKFLGNNSKLLKNISPEQLSKIKELKEKIALLQGKINMAEQLKAAINERRKFLQERLAQFGMKKDIDKITQKLYYYKEYLNEYKQLLNDPDKLQKKLLAALHKMPAFEKFMQENSFLAGLFSSPSLDPSSTQQTLQGLQARYAVNQSLQQRLFSNTTNPSQYLQDKVSAAKEQLNTLKNKVNSLTSGKDEIEMPNFKPNSQKIKSFLKRLEYGGNVQFARSNNLLPTSGDFAVSVGYKINDKSTVGIATSYKAGFGSGWDNIKLTNQGIGFRSFVDMKLKGAFFISGGYEQNYLSAFQSISQLREYSSWQSSALLGISKKYQISKKVKGNMQLLFDFLHAQHFPQTQALLFRLGYTLK